MQAYLLSQTDAASVDYFSWLLGVILDHYNVYSTLSVGT